MSCDSFEDSGYFDKLISHHQGEISNSKRLIKWLVYAGLATFSVGAVIWVLAATRRIDVSLAPSIVAIIGIVLSGGSLVPYKDISPSRLKILRYEKMKQECERIKDLPEPERRAHLKNLHDYLKGLD